VLASNAAVSALAMTATEVGTVSAGLLLASDTMAPAGDVLFRVRVQRLKALGPRLAGLQASETRTTGATRLMVAFWEAPLRVAVTVAA